MGEPAPAGVPEIRDDVPMGVGPSDPVGPYCPCPRRSENHAESWEQSLRLLESRLTRVETAAANVDHLWHRWRPFLKQLWFWFGHKLGQKGEARSSPSAGALQGPPVRSTEQLPA